MISSPSVSSVTSSGIVEVADVDRGVEVDERLDRVLDRLRQVVRQRPDRDRLDRVEQRAAVQRHGRRLADGDERHVDGQLLGHADQEQVDVERPAVDRVDLDARGRGPAGPSRRRPTGRPARSGRCWRRSCSNSWASTRDVRRVDAVAVDDGRAGGRPAEAGDLLAGDLAVLGGQRRRGRWTWMRDLWMSVGSCGRIGLRLAGGAGYGEAPGDARRRVPRLARGARTGGCRARCSIARWPPPSSSSKTSTPSRAGIQYALQQEGYEVAVARPARRAWTSPRTRRPTSSCSTSACRASTGSRSCAACARPAPRCRSSS